jgi:hypothetical protein
MTENETPTELVCSENSFVAVIVRNKLADLSV